MAPRSRSARSRGATSHTYRDLGLVDPERQIRADSAVRNLQNGSRRPQYDLERAGWSWFQWFPDAIHPRRAAPTVDGIRTVAAFVGHPDENVALAALSALDRAAVVLDRRAFPTLPASWTGIPEAREAVAVALQDERVPVRINAFRLVADFPEASFRASFRVGLGDPVYTVRWHAVRALARLGDVDGLDVVLAESRPRTERDDYAHAVAVLATRAG